MTILENLTFSSYSPDICSGYPDRLGHFFLHYLSLEIWEELCRRNLDRNQAAIQW